MNDREKSLKQHRQEVKESQRRNRELEANPLSQYSTTQLKKELRREKKNNDIYLTIITTVLVLTQVIRITQNHISLRRQKVIFEAQLGELVDAGVTKEDFEMQRKAYRLIVERLERELMQEEEE